MKVQLRPARIRAAAALCGIAAIAAAAAVAAPADAARSPQAAHHPSAVAAAAKLPVVINCAGHGQTRPRQYVLACGDGKAFLTGLHWASWGSAAGFGSGTSVFNDCIPNCVAGHVHKFPVLVALWRVRPLPHHPGQRYFTELTVIYTGNRSYRAGGKTLHVPPTPTFPLSPFGGA